MVVDPTDSTHVMLYEVYDDEKAFEAIITGVPLGKLEELRGA